MDVVFPALAIAVIFVVVVLGARSGGGLFTSPRLDILPSWAWAVMLGAFVSAWVLGSYTDVPLLWLVSCGIAGVLSAAVIKDARQRRGSANRG